MYDVDMLDRSIRIETLKQDFAATNANVINVRDMRLSRAPQSPDIIALWDIYCTRISLII